MRRPVLVPLGALAFLLLLVAAPTALHLILYEGIWSLLPEDTEYAASFDERQFRDLSLPIRNEELRHLLGEPLLKMQRPSGGEAWIYSRSPGDTHYRVRTVVVVDGMAIEKIHEFYVD